jgi:hypothetical protein
MKRSALKRVKGFKPRKSSRGKSRLARAPFRRDGVDNYGGTPRPRTKPLNRSGIHAKPYHSIDTHKGLVDANDEVVSYITREREPACIVCGSTEDLTNGHLFSRRYHATRFDVTEDGNCHVQCWGCNKAHQFNRNPYTFAFVKRFGAEAHAKVRDRAFSGQKFTQIELREMLESNRALLRTMKRAA